MPGLAGHLLHSHRAASSHDTTKDASGAWVESAPAARIHLRGLDGTPAALDAALAQMRELRPQQVMLESCAQRRALAERRSAAVAASAAKEDRQVDAQGQEAETAASATSKSVGQPMSHADAVSKVHGGITGRDIVSITAAAGSVGAQVYVVDREYQETQNRVARRLWVRPKEMLAFTRHSLAAFAEHSQPIVAGEKAAHVNDSLEDQCPAVHEILVSEREAHMTAEINRRAVRGADVLVLCTTERVGGLQRCLGQPEAVLSEGSGSKTSRVWPFLLVFVYLLVPMYGTVFVSWRISRRLGDFFSAHVSSGIGFPLPGEGDGPVDSEPPQGVPSQSSAA